jgi:hypothetical protein
LVPARATVPRCTRLPDLKGDSGDTAALLLTYKAAVTPDFRSSSDAHEVRLSPDIPVLPWGATGMAGWRVLDRSPVSSVRERAGRDEFV